MSLDLPDHTDREFSVEARHDGDAIHLTMTGNADMHAIEPLTAMLEKLHVEALRLTIKQVVIDIKQLEFMNSSCVKAFVALIASLQETPQPAQYRLRFQSNPELRWQRRSLHSLQCFATDLITVEE
jgi:anti-anti-sigma factor